MARRLWITCKRFTVSVTWADDGTVRDAAPIVRRFNGQPLENLLRWAESLGGMRWEDISGEPVPESLDGVRQPDRLPRPFRGAAL